MAEKHVPLPPLDQHIARQALDERLRDLTNDNEDRNFRRRGFSLLGEHLEADEITLNIPAGIGSISVEHKLESREGIRLTPNRFIPTWRDVDVSLQAAGTWTASRVTFDYHAATAATVKVLLMRRDD